ncbi:uncharacterized protein [Epargyreus clarus]|uniref:uncharacterized protein isoform X2 n=1 Tax=Epargyreus clarus TaxID=520877 RepID=UPI003C2BD2DC
MKVLNVTYFTFIVLFVLFSSENVISEESPFELPVQLVGFPAIVLSVRLTNFLKKLAYTFSPATYRSRARRELTFIGETSEPFDAKEVEKYITGEFGAKACVFERVCAHYATRARSSPKPQMDWPDVFSQYKRSPDQVKELYLLSVFLGDIVGSPQLCHQLGKRRGCDDTLLGSTPQQ